MGEYSFKRIVGVVTVIGLVAAGVVAGAVWKRRVDALGDAERGVVGLAGMLAEQVQHSSQAIDFAVNEVEGAVAASDQESFRRLATSAETQRVLIAAADKRHSIDLISIDDAEGVAVATSRGVPAPVRRFDDPQFERLRAERDAEIRVGALHVSEATGEMVVDVVKRLEAADGSFLGAIRVSVKPSALVNSYSPISAMPGQSYALFARDGQVLVRYPISTAVTPGQKLSRKSQWYDLVAHGGGQYRTFSAFDDQERIIAVRVVPFSQFVVTVSVKTETALAHWRVQAGASAFAVLLVAIAAGMLMRSLAVQFRRLADKEAALHAQSRALALSNDRFAAALGSMSQGLVVFDRSGRVVISNEKYAAMYGLATGQIYPGMNAREILELRAARGVYAGHAPQSYIKDAMSRRFNDRRVDHLTDGRSILVNHSVCADGGLVVTHEDITEREQAGRRIAHMALHDELTGLANRALFMETLSSLRREIGSTCAAVVVALIDLDDFKPVNDTRGHAAGDAVLRECAARILREAPDARVVARLGGDEFALAFGVSEVDEAACLQFAQRIAQALAVAYVFQGHSVEIDACAGVAIVAEPELSPDDMMRRADLALYAAKATGAGVCRLFEPQMELEAMMQRELAADLAAAIANDELVIAYQPVVDADTLQIRQMEALLRWNHPQRGPISPLCFIKLAEETRLIGDLGKWVLRRACADAANWPEHVGVAVNVSPLQLAGDDFTAIALDALNSAGLAAHRLEIEITESVLLQDKGDSLTILHRLRDRGVSIALDDFGTGFSSMSYLTRFPFDRLKIDRSFVMDAPRDPRSAAIIAATVEIARAFDIEVTAEGVETYEQRQTLRAAGVRLMQGYLFGRPAPICGDLPTIAAAAQIPTERRVA